MNYLENVCFLCIEKILTILYNKNIKVGEAMKRIRTAIHSICILSGKAREDYVSAHSGHGALFIIISVFPLLILLLAMIKHTGIGEDELLDLLQGLAPKAFEGIIADSVSKIFLRLGRVAVSITVITLLWSASGFIYSITLGLNRIYHYKETRNYFLLRGISLIYTLLFLILLLFIISLSMFSKGFTQTLSASSNTLGAVLNFFGKLLSFLLILFVSALFYTFIPKRKNRLLYQLPGAAVTAICWYIFSLAYPIYLRYFSNISYIYGGLAVAILWLWWLYFSMYIFFLGAEVNVLLTRLGLCKNKRKEERE